MNKIKRSLYYSRSQRIVGSAPLVVQFNDVTTPLMVVFEINVWT